MRFAERRAAMASEAPGASREMTFICHPELARDLGAAGRLDAPLVSRLPVLGVGLIRPPE
jgi:hypothetical protein